MRMPITIYFGVPFTAESSKGREKLHGSKKKLYRALFKFAMNRDYDEDKEELELYDVREYIGCINAALGEYGLNLISFDNDSESAICFWVHRVDNYGEDSGFVVPKIDDEVLERGTALIQSLGIKGRHPMMYVEEEMYIL